MRPLIRWLQSDDVSRVALTVRASAKTPGDSAMEVFCHAFAEFDTRRLPVTWAVVRGGEPWPLADVVVGSSVPHELAFWLDRRHLTEAQTTAARQQALARQARLRLRTLVTDASGVHPALLARLPIEAVVSTASAAQRSRTGALSAVAWNLWEVPITDRATIPILPDDARRLQARLATLLRHSTRMHLLWVVGGGDTRGLQRPLDLLAEYAERGWLQVEPAAAAAARQSRAATGQAAA